MNDSRESKTANDLLDLHLQLGLSLNSTLGIEKSLDLILQFSCQIEGLDCGGIFCLDRITGSLELMSHRGLPNRFIKRCSRLDFAAPQTRLVMKGRPIYSVSPEDHMVTFIGNAVSEKYFSFLALIPVQYDGRVTAALFLFSRSLTALSIDTRNTLEAIATRIASVIAREEAVKALKESEDRYRNLLATMNEGFVIVDDTFTLTYANERMCELLGYELDEIIGLPISYFLDDENRNILASQQVKRRKGEMEPYELTWTREDGQRIVTRVSPRPIADLEGNFKGSFSVITDVTELKKTEAALRTIEKNLKIEKKNLEELNTALKVLLEKRDEDVGEFEKKIILNVKKLVMPYLEKMKVTSLDEIQSTYMNIIESNLNEIVSSFSLNLSVRYSELTHTEIQIANLIQEGMTSKEIASVLNLSHRTVDCHRLNIRKKLGLRGKRANLRSHLSRLR